MVSFFLLGSAREWTWRLAANPRVLGVLSRLMATTVLGQSIIFHKSEISNPAVRLFDVCFLFRKRLHGCPKDAENHFKTQDMHRSGSPGNYSEYFWVISAWSLRVRHMGVAANQQTLPRVRHMAVIAPQGLGVSSQMLRDGGPCSPATWYAMIRGYLALHLWKMHENAGFIKL